MRKINEIVVHCTATNPDWWASRSINQKISEIRKWHINQRGWSDIGYHYLIDRDGKIGVGRPVEKIGAHVQGRNEGTIGISLLGGYDAANTDRFDSNFTALQNQAIRSLISDLSKRFSINIISGHNQYAAKACPGFDVRKWI